MSTATMIATMTDFEQFGDFEVFVTEEQVKALEEHVRHKGYIDAADLTRLFALLRANDLTWSSGISSYLLAEDAIASDLLYWFADGIGMPGKMLRTFMRSVILENGLAKPGGLTIGGNPINVKDIRTPLCFVSLRDDHVAGWQDTYRGARQFQAEMRFIMQDPNNRRLIQPRYGGTQEWSLPKRYAVVARPCSPRGGNHRRLRSPRQLPYLGPKPS